VQKRSIAFSNLRQSRDLPLFAVMLVGVAVFGVVDGSWWRSLLAPTLAYRTAFLFSLALLFGWRGFVLGQIVFVVSFASFLGWRGTVFVEPLYLLSHACALIVSRRLAGNEPWLSREKSTLAFLAGAALAPALPSLLNVPMLHLVGIKVGPGLLSTVDSWLRQGAAILALGPALLVCGSGRLKEWLGEPAERAWRQPIDGRNVLELVLELSVWTAALWITVHFKARFGLNVTYLTFFPPLAFTLFKGMRLATLALAANAMIATTLWSQLGWGDVLSVGDLRLLIAIYSTTILILAAVVDERQRGKRQVEELLMEEAILRQSEEHFRTLANSATLMIWVSGPDELCNFVNKPWLDFRGRSMEQELGNSWTDGVHPDDVARCIAAFHSSFEARTRLQCDCRILRADGEYRSILVNGAPMYRDGVFAGYLGSSVDITEQNLSTERLRASETRLKHAQRLARVGSFERHIKSGTSYWSDEKLRIFGLAQTPGQADFLRYVHAEDRERVREAQAQSLAGATPVEVEYRIVRPDGETRIVRSTFEGIRNSQGEVVRIAGASQDITDMRRTQEETFARQKLETLGTLANGIAHDFNNLLGGVVAQAELARADFRSGDPPEEELKAICDIALRGSEIVRELMIYAGTESEDLVSLDVSQVVTEMLELLKHSVSKRVTIDADVGRNLLPVRANPARISQIVMNLVMNASEAVGDLDGVIRISTCPVTSRDETPGSASPKRQNYVQLKVTDTGCGIRSEIQARIFEPFFSTKSRGRGQGLAVVYGIVRGLGGTIHIASTAGRGTTFEILLPCDETASGTVDRPSAAFAKAVPQSRAATVLVVEDEDQLRQAVVKMLEKKSFSVIEAQDGSAAIEMIREYQNPIDVILLDITLPGSPSWKVFQDAMSLKPEARIIATSAYSEERATELLRASPAGFLRKPYLLDDLIEMISQTSSENPGASCGPSV
jgi:PAS domain S-box-containing protein